MTLPAHLVTLRRAFTHSCVCLCACAQMANICGLMVNVNIDATWAEWEAALATSATWRGRCGDIVYDQIGGHLKRNIVDLVRFLSQSHLGVVCLGLRTDCACISCVQVSGDATGLCARAMEQYWTTGQIMVVLDALLEQEASPSTFFDNGDIVIALYPADEGFARGLERIGVELVNQMLDTDNNLPLPTSLNVKRHEPEVAQLLDRIAQATQLPMEPFVDVDFGELSQAVDL